MAVSSLKGCWYKFSARIRDAIDVVDSYYRPPSADNNDSGSARIDALAHQFDDNADDRNKTPHHRNHHHHYHTCDRATTNNKRNGHQRRLHHHTNNRTTDCKPDFVSSAHSQLPACFTKRKTTQGQIYFVDNRGQKYWHDPTVPKDLLTASIDLDSLVGRLSPTVWEVRQTPSGKTYYVNHFKKTTQFTDPRLVAHKEYLMSILKNEQTRSKVGSNIKTTSVCNTTSNSSNDRQHQPKPYSLYLSTTDCLEATVSHSNTQNTRNCNACSQHLKQRTCHQRNQLDNSNKLINTQHNLQSSELHCTAASSQQNHYTQHDFLDHLSHDGIPRPRDPVIRSTPRQTIRYKIRSHNEPLSVDNHQTNELTGNTPNTLGSVTAIFNANQSHDSTIPLNSANNIHNPLSQPGEQGFYSRKSKDLYDKILILRQELLKQQVIAHACRIDINRKRIFEESFKVISQMHPKDLKKRLLVKFRGEEGLDYGGVAREWFHLLSREILNPIHGLFQYTSDDIYNLQINPDSGIVYREHLSYLNFCGRVIGMAVFHGHFIEGHFTVPFYKMLLKKPITLADIENVDPDLHRSLCWILDNDVTNVIDTTFLVQHNAFGELQEHELKENGRNIVVTEANKHDYVSRYVNYRCRRGIESQFEALSSGFNELISPSLLENFDEYELELLIGGLSTIDIEDWRLHTKLKNCHVETPLVKWFWEIVKSYSEDQRARLLQFVTGSPRVPIQGFKALQGFNSELRLFTIHLIKNACTDDLPKSHTCFNRIDIPPYESYEKLHDKLTTAIEETMGFAMQ